MTPPCGDRPDRGRVGRRAAARGLLLAGLPPLLARRPAAAQQAAFPARPIRLVVTLSPGSSSDILARVMADEMARLLGQPIIVENRPGAGGSVAAEHVARANPDGHTLLLASVSSHGINPAVYARLPYDAVRDFRPVSLIASSPNVLVVKSGGHKSVSELVAAARRDSGRLAFSSGGVGTSHHLAGEMLCLQAGIRAEHVPYRGSPEAVIAVQNGETDFMFPNAPNAIALAEAGLIRILAVTTPSRVSFLPDVPTMAESGLPGFDVTAWFGIVAPVHTPTGALAALHGAAARALDAPAVRSQLAAQWFEPIGGTPEAFGRFMQEEIERWRATAGSRGIALR